MEITLKQRLSETSLDRYIPFYLANGDFGGTFDPFAGTYYDELTAGGGATRDIRTLLRAGIRAVDFWEKQVFSPDAVTMNDLAIRLWREAREAGKGDRTTDVRGQPFTLRIGVDDPEFPSGVTHHVQTLDVAAATLRTEYQFRGRSVRVDTFVHPKESVLVYRFHLATPMVLDVEGPQAACDPSGGFRFFSGHSNTWCPFAMGVWASRGAWEGNRLKLPEGTVDLAVAYGHRRLGVPMVEARRALEWAAAIGFDNLSESHKRWWQERWSRSEIRIPDADLQTMWWLSLYYMICSQPRRVVDGLCSEAGLSASYAVFNTGYHPQDSIMAMMSAPAVGMTDLCEASMEWIEEVAPVAREYARSAFWLPGARYVWHGGPGMLPYVTGHSHHGGNLNQHHVNGWVAVGIHRFLQGRGWRPKEMERWLPLLKDLAAFFVGMMSPRDGGWEIRYLPAMSQAEVPHIENQPNIFDTMASARYTVMLAGEVARRLKTWDPALRGWDEMQSKLRFDILATEDGGYRPYEGATDTNLKVPSQLTGVWFPILHTLDRAVMKKTADLFERDVRPGSCGWSLPSVALAQARLGDGKTALRHLRSMIDPATGFTDDRQIMFRECDKRHIPGGLEGRMPYYQAAHGLYAAAICEMLVQDWSGETRFFPACPWEEASFRLWSNGRCFAGVKQGREVRVTRV